MRPDARQSPAPAEPRRSARDTLPPAGALCVFCVLAGVQPQPARVFDLPQGRPVSIVVTRSVEAPALAPGDSDMLLTLSGVIGTIPPRDANRLRSMVRAGRSPDSLEGASLVGVIHLVGSSSSKRVEILALPDGSMVASEVDPLDEGGVAAAAVLAPEFADLASTWSRYRGGFGPDARGDTPVARNVDMAHPYQPGWFTFDEQTLGDRFLNGGSTNLRGMARDLESETLWVRLPAGYDPLTPPGLLVWIDPTDSGQPPAFMHEAADASNCMIVGAAMAGNDRYIADRHQLQFDAIATATSRYHVDPSRIYAVGVSGGGRVACMYWACFPDVFAGAISIVGTSCYENVPMGNGAYMPRGFTLPTGSRQALRGHRLAAITGARDFNALEIRQTVSIFESDSFQARLFEFEDMAHEYPSPDRFGRTLEWIDEPRRLAREESVERAAALMEAFRRRRATPPAPGDLTPGERETLVRVTHLAPWSEPAWEATRHLGLDAPVVPPSPGP